MTRGSLAPGRVSIAPRLASIEQTRKSHPGAAILDVTARGPLPWLRFSPYHPHGGIPVPGLPGREAETVEGIWQGLKVFEREGADLSLLESRALRELRRGGAERGRVLGHRWGEGEGQGGVLLPYLEARLRLFVPAYGFVLEHRLAVELEELVRMAEVRDLVLLDFTTNEDIGDPRRPLSHASLVRRWLEDDWPQG